MNIIFQAATKTDILLLQELARTVWRNHYPGIISHEQIDYMLNKMYSAQVLASEIEKGICWVIIFDDLQPIGFISYHTDSDEKKVKLSKLYILTNYHGKGIGQAALQFVINKSIELNAHKLYLTVNKQNIKAIDAYKRAGFYVDSEVVADIGNGYVMDDYIMVFDIGVE